MVKGLSKRVVVVRFPDTRVFEQAIFIVREDVGKGVTADDVVVEACNVAENYVKHPRKSKTKQPSPLIFGIAGAGITGIAWILTLVF